ncbi:MAG: radical SAM protein [Candidatus Lokiarchaeota archaeon]|nr:radical SAM protein [Candidatus Lokiarchaeota archaeon]
MKIGMVYGASISYEIGGGAPHEYENIHTPLGLAYPLAMVRKNFPNVEIKIIDQAYHNSSNERMLNLILSHDFDLLGFSTYVWNSISVYNWIKEIKKEQKDIKIVAGGPHFTYIPSLLMKRLNNLDFVIKKEGEIPFLKLVEKLMDNDDTFEEVPSIVFRRGNKIIDNNLEKPPIDLDNYPSPYLTGILDEYLDSNCKYLGLQTSRGCPFNCAYCVWNIQSTFEGFPRIRYFSTDRVIKELRYIQDRTKTDVSIEIYDATFNENKKRLLELCEKIKDNRIKLRLGVRIRADLLTDEQVKTLKSMGVWIIRVGIESVGESLKAVKRSQSQLKIETNLKSIRESGIMISGNIMIGLPQQSKEEILKTIEYVKKLKINAFTVNVYDPPSGKDIYNNPKNFGMKEFKETIDGRKSFESDFLNRKEIIGLAKKGNDELNYVLFELLKKYKSLMAFS